MSALSARASRLSTYKGDAAHAKPEAMRVDYHFTRTMFGDGLG